MTPTNAQEAQATDADYYVENGRVVFTAAYHLRRGHCCGSGCRHCPYASDAKHDASVDGDTRKWA